jgi:hypothetical protein
LSNAGDFDMQAAWLRRFQADAESNLAAFAHRLKEAMSGQVVIHEKRSLFGGTVRITGVSVDLGEHRYILMIEGNRLKADIAMVVRGITLNTKSVDPADWFARLAQETHNASDHARALSNSLSTFMAN